MAPVPHILGGIPCDVATSDQQPQYAYAHSGLDHRGRFGINVRTVKSQLSGRSGKYAIDHAAMKVDVGVERGSEAVDKTHRTSAGALSDIRLQAALDLTHKYA